MTDASRRNAAKGLAEAGHPWRAMSVIGTLFFLFGMVTWLNGSLIPYLKLVCNLTNEQALLVTFAFYIAYTVLALPMSGLLARTGYRRGMAVGLGIMAVAALMHIPAALLASYPLFLLALFTLGAGLTILQTASNPYIVLLGPLESAATRISVMGILNKAAGVLVPVLFSAVILGGLGDAAHVPADAAALGHKLVVPYLVMAGLLVGLIGLVMGAALPDVAPAVVPAADAGRTLGSHPQLVLGAIALFGYVGVEVLAADTIGLFGQTLGLASYSVLTSYTMSGMVAGYLIGIACIPRLFSQRTALAGCGVAGIAAVGGILLSSASSSAISQALWGWTGIPIIPDPVLFVAAMGLAHALVWPALWPMALSGLGEQTARGSALLIMSICGGALLPLAFGRVATHLTSMQNAYAIALPWYVLLVYYALAGSRLRAW